MRTPPRWKATGSIAIGLLAAACATTAQNTESLLGQAGFRRVAADTSQKMTHLKTLPERALVARTHQGQRYYVYADPSYCKCMYVGNAEQYQAYQRLTRQQRAAEEAALAAEEAKEWELESCCGVK
jgi:16S rRNA G966 N2-methylase RsmD